MSLPAVMSPGKSKAPITPSRRSHSRRANSVDNHQHHIELPRLRELAKRAAPQVIEATLIPLALFYVALWALGPKGAICTALGWTYFALLRRIWLRERLPGVLVIAALGLTARSVVALASGSSGLFVYFLQPSLATALVGGAFLFSVPLGRPLAEKLAHDFVPMPPAFFKGPKVRQLFVKISLLWALVSLINAAATITLLLNVPIATYLAAKTGVSCSLTLGGILLSSWWFRRSLRRHGADLPDEQSAPAGPVAQVALAAAAA
jgi:hypothetical protein